MPQDASGIRCLDQLMIGFDLLQWLQAELATRGQAVRLGTSFSPGWLGSSWGNGRPDYGWELWDNGGNLSTRTAATTTGHRLRKVDSPYLGVDPFGNVLEVDPDAPMLDHDGAFVTVPNDGVWYTLVATYLLDTHEPGTLALTAGSAAVVGTNTNFRRYGITPEASIIRIDADDSIAGNEGLYPVAAIADATHMTLDRVAPATETALRYSVSGQFFGGAPADPDCHLVARVAWIRRARTVAAPSDAIIAYDVKRAPDGTLSVIDRRHAQICRHNGGIHRGYLPTFPARYDDTSAGLGGATLLGASTIYTCAANEIVSHLSLTGCTDGGWTTVADGVDQPVAILAGLLVENTSTGNDRFVIKTGIPWQGPSSGRWFNPDNGGAAVNVTSETGLLGIALTALPLGTGFTHLAFYIDSSGNLKTKTSVDNGANWVGPATIWTPPGADVLGAGGVAVLLTRLGRLIAVGSYKPGGGAAELRYIYSDDYGVTWTKNSEAGFSILANAAECPTLVEDDDGNIWLAYRSGGDTGSAETFLIRGAGINDPTPDASVPGDGWTFGDPPAGGTAGRKLVALVPAPGGGNLAAFYTSQADAGAYSSWLGVASISEGRVLHDDGKTIVLYDDPTLTTAYANPEPIATYVGHNGLVWVAALAGYDVGGNAKVRSYIAALQPLHRAHAFYPGY